MGEDVAVFLAPAPGIECDNPGVIELAARVCAGARGEVAKAEALFLWVRDQIAYTMTAPFWELEHYLASAVIARGKGYCVQKSALLVTLARAAGIPARMCFADIDNLAIAPPRGPDDGRPRLCLAQLRPVADRRPVAEGHAGL
ncbi:transglutaminase-like domain-containing protein [Desulfarculus baarsii]